MQPSGSLSFKLPLHPVVGKGIWGARQVGYWVVSSVCGRTSAGRYLEVPDVSTNFRYSDFGLLLSNPLARQQIASVYELRPIYSINSLQQSKKITYLTHLPAPYRQSRDLNSSNNSLSPYLLDLHSPHTLQTLVNYKSIRLFNIQTPLISTSIAYDTIPANNNVT